MDTSGKLYPFDSAYIVSCGHGSSLTERHGDPLEDESDLAMLRRSMQRHYSKYECVCTVAELWPQYFLSVRKKYTEVSL